jgi:positive phototaxis protein PixI
MSHSDFFSPTLTHPAPVTAEAIMTDLTDLTDLDADSAVNSGADLDIELVTDPIDSINSTDLDTALDTALDTDLDTDLDTSLSTSLSTDLVADSRQQFLRLYLAADFPALLPIHQVKEVLTVPRDQIVPIPDMPAWVMGIYNWRGEILWMVDLGHLCGLTPWYQQPTYISMHSTIVLRVPETTPDIHREISRETPTPIAMQTLGLVVNSVEDMEVCDLALIQALPLSSLPSQLASFLHGYWWKADNDMLAVFAGEAIIAAMPKSHPY